MREAGPPEVPLRQLLSDRTEDILARWEQARRREPARRDAPVDTLRDGLPALLAAIGDAADHVSPRHADAADRAREIAVAHARHRLEQRFGLDEVCREYALLRRLVIEVLWSDDRPVLAELACIDHVLDGAVEAAVTTYVEDSARALRAREALLGEILEQLPLGAIVADRNGGAPLTNARARDLLSVAKGKVAAAVEGALDAHRLDGAALRPEEWPLRRSLERGEDVAGEEIDVVMEDGRPRTVRVSSAAVRSADGSIRAGVALLEDVTERRRAEAERARLFREIDESRKLLEAVVAQMPAGVVVLDVAGTILYANTHLEEIFGFPVRLGDCVTSYADRYRGHRPTGGRIRPPDWPIVRTLRNGETVLGELVELERQDGTRASVRVSSVPVLDDTGRAFAGLALVQDVTAQERAERDRARLAAIVESSSDLVAMAAPDGRITYVNEAGRRMAGLSPDDDPSRLTLSDFGTPAVHEAVIDALRRRERWTGEIELRNVAERPGATTPVVCSVFAFGAASRRRDTGPDTSIAVIAHDVTAERRRSEFERQLVGIVGHDLKNPLHAILLSSDLLLRLPLDPGARTLVEKIGSACRRAVRLVHEVLDFTQARLGGGLPLRAHETDLAAVVSQVVEELRLAHPGRAIVSEPIGDLRGTWDGERLAQVVTNLATNAIKHGAEDRPIGVRARGLDGEVVIEVRNEGPDIPEHVRTKLFEPMRHGGGSGAGLGLGLFIVRHVVERHGGSIAVRSSGGETVFEVRLPRDGASASARQRPSRDSLVV